MTCTIYIFKSERGTIVENNIYPFSDVTLTKDDIILLDTSFVLNLANSDINSTVSQECNDLTLKIIQNKATVAISLITYEELHNVFLKIQYRDHFGNSSFCENDVKTWTSGNPQSFQAAIDATISARDNYMKLLQNSPAFYTDPIGQFTPETFARAVELQKKYALPGLNDAKQIAIAIEESVSCFATTDHDFLRINEEGLKILVDTRTYNRL